jgi:hypothetical protein
MLVLINPGNKFVTFGNIDVYLEPLIEELQMLWNGIKAYDSLQGITFNSKAMCI